MTELTASARPSYVYGVHGEGEGGRGEGGGGGGGGGDWLAGPSVTMFHVKRGRPSCAEARRSPVDHVTEDVSRETGTDLHLLSAPEAVDETDVSRETD